MATVPPIAWALIAVIAAILLASSALFWLAVGRAALKAAASRTAASPLLEAAQLSAELHELEEKHPPHGTGNQDPQAPQREASRVASAK
jgi:hypothetical protein